MPVKWLDNVICHHPILGVVRARQGIARRLSPNSIVVLEIGLRLSRILGIPTARALDLATQLAAQEDSPARLLIEGTGELSVDVAAIRRETMVRLGEAVEIAPVPRRGRPRR